MDILHHPGESTRPEGGTVLTIGVYDGVHLGHRHVINEVRAGATEMGARSAVVTFDPHPASVLRPESAPKLLTELDQKLELLAAAGVDTTMVVRFDRARSEESAEDFVERILVDRLGARWVIVGEDFHFGHGRKGNIELLTRMGDQFGFGVTGVRPFRAEARDATGASAVDVVSSTRIRALLVTGDVESAASLLGRPHGVRGIVGHGDKRGRTLGYPTANVAVPSGVALPAEGVYAGWYRRPGGSRLPAAVSLGRRPTFYVDADLSLLEAHLLDFDGDLYDESAQVEFVGRLRGQQAFASADALIEQMGHDVGAARRMLAAPSI
jgi:riboflavin kinase/FMN adenylyltransferase